MPSLPEHVRAPRPSHATQLRMAPRDPNPTTQSWVSFCPSIVCEAQSGGLPGIGHRHSFDVRQNQAKAGLHWTQRRVGVSFHLWEKGAPLAPPVAPQTRRRPPAPHGPTPPLSQHKAREHVHGDVLQRHTAQSDEAEGMRVWVQGSDGQQPSTSTLSQCSVAGRTCRKYQAPGSRRVASNGARAHLHLGWWGSADSALEPYTARVNARRLTIRGNAVQTPGRCTRWWGSHCVTGWGLSHHGVPPR